MKKTLDKKKDIGRVKRSSLKVNWDGSKKKRSNYSLKSKELLRFPRREMMKYRLKIVSIVFKSMS
jgi:hypothetical protein